MKKNDTKIDVVLGVLFIASLLSFVSLLLKNCEAVLAFLNSGINNFKAVNIIGILFSLLCMCCSLLYIFIREDIVKSFRAIEKAEKLLAIKNVLLVDECVEIGSMKYAIAKDNNSITTADKLRESIEAEKEKIRKRAIWPFHKFYTKRL